MADYGHDLRFGTFLRPKPDGGLRRTDVRLWDESARPSAPAAPADHSIAAHPSGAGRALVEVHDHLRQELSQIFDLVDQVEAGHIDIGTARSHINEMTIRQNNWTLGTYCESYCRVVTTHHTIEDVSVFPHLRRVEPQLGPVLDRLMEEHGIIHGVIEGVDRALVALVGGGDLKSLRAAVDLLADTLLSHLTYEEHELVQPLTRYGFQ
jgi:hemerythrin-like domain-containing protein